MSRKYQIKNPEGLYFCTLTVVRWIDLFTRPRYRELLLENLQFCQKRKGLHINGYVVMTNHLHLLAWSEPEHPLPQVLKEFKSYTAKVFLESLKQEPESRDWILPLFRSHAVHYKPSQAHQVWIHGSHPKEAFSPLVAMQKLEYIHLNPVKAGWVRSPADWVYSSAGNYLRGEGILEVELLPLVYL